MPGPARETPPLVEETRRTHLCPRAARAWKNEAVKSSDSAILGGPQRRVKPLQLPRASIFCCEMDRTLRQESFRGTRALMLRCAVWQCIARISLAWAENSAEHIYSGSLPRRRNI